MEGRGAGNGAEPERGPPASLRSGRVPFKTRGRRVGGGGEGAGRPLQCFLGDEVHLRRAELYEAPRELQIPECSAWAPGHHAPGLGFGLRPLAQLRWPPAEGRLQNEGRRWVRRARGGGCSGPIGEGTRAHRGICPNVKGHLP